MFKILKLCLFLFLFSALGAESKLDLDRYRLYVAEVDPESHSFALSNKMIFQIAKKNWTTDQLPEVGAEVRFAPLHRDDERYSVSEGGEFLVLSFLPKESLNRVWMPEESKAHCLTYVGSESICVEPAGWISSAKYREVFELSDGSKWMADMEGPFFFKLGDFFKQGDRLLLSKITNIQWGIMDIDQSICVKGKDGKDYVRFFAVTVKPYDQK